MDTEKLRCFISVVEAGNMAMASKRLNISQSAISYQIKQLETELGFPLFVRSSWKRLSLTSAGRQVYDDTLDFMKAFEKYMQTVSSISNAMEGSLKIATFESMAITWLPGIISVFKEQYPKIQIYVKEGDNAFIEPALVNNTIDFAFTSYRERQGIEWIKLAEDPIMAVFPPMHKFGSLASVPIKYFNEEPFIMSMNLYDYDVNKVLEDNNITPRNIICSSQNDHTILQMIADGLGSSLLYSRILKTINTNEIVIKPIEPYYSRELGIAVRSFKSASPAARKFIEITKKWIEKNSPDK